METAVEKPARSRSCYDRVRLERIRQRRSDPAMSTAASLLALVFALFGRMPVAPRLIAPSRGPVIDRERGEGGSLPGLRSRGRTGSRYRVRPSYRRLVLDLRRPAVRAEATEILRRRAPEEVLPWLDELIEREEWTSLSTVARTGLSDDVVELRMLQEALAWVRSKDEDDELFAVPVETGSALKPSPESGDGVRARL